MANEDVTIALSLRAALDPRSLSDVKVQLDSMVKNRKMFHVEPSQLQSLAKMAREVQEEFVKAGVPMHKALEDYGAKFQILAGLFEKAQQDYATAVAAADQQSAEAAQDRLDQIKKGMEAIGDVAKSQAQRAVTGKSFLEGGKGLAEGFVSTMDSLKAGDLEGMTKAFFGGGAKLLSKQAMKAAASSAAQQAAGGSGAGAATLAAGLGTAATALAGVTAIFGVLLGLIIGVDNEMKALNATMLDGMGIGDAAYGDLKDGIEALSPGLKEAQTAVSNLFMEFGGDRKEYMGAIAALQQGGFTFREIQKQAGGVEGTLRGLLLVSKATGMSLSETANIYADFQENVGFGQEQLQESFLKLTAYAQASGMGTKRFFTNVSQASAGMAIYNMRIEQAASLLLVTSKILGEADGSAFVKDLTKGFADKSITDRLGLILRKGTGDVAKGFQASLETAMQSFAETFGKNDNIKQAFQKALGAAAVDVDLADPKELTKLLSKASDSQMSALRATLFKMTDDPQSEAALRQLQTLSDLLGASTGDMSNMTKAMGALSMQAKLALKFDNILDVRLDEMNALQLAAVEATEDMSGEQLEQARRVSQVLFDLYSSQVGAAKAAKGGRSAFLDWVRTSDLAASVVAKNQTDVKGILGTSTDWAAETAKNTTTMADYLAKIAVWGEQYLKPLVEGMNELVAIARGDTKFLADMEARRDAEKKAAQQAASTALPLPPFLNAAIDYATGASTSEPYPVSPMPANDFVMRPGQPAQRFSSADTLIGMKDNGPIDKAMGIGGGGTVINHIHINGNDTAMVYETVRRAIKASK